jgi:hypothetical protein
MNKTELVATLRANGADAAKTLRALPPDAFEAGRYENGWNAREILAHVASIEWTYPRLIDLARVNDTPQPADAPAPAQPAAVRRTEPDPSGAVPTSVAQGGILSYNDRQVAKRADATIADLISEFEKNRAATIAAVESADDALFAKEIRSAGGITGTLADVINAVAIQHVQMHVADIAGSNWTGQRF